jgi:dCMP deaminase
MSEQKAIFGTPFVNYEPPSWDEYFMRLFYLVATKSKDPRTKIGAVLVKGKRVIATGYNGICICVDDTVPARSERPEKYKWYEHAERNCIFSAATIGIPTTGSTMYTNGTPCADCTRAVVQSGVKRVVVHKTYEDLFCLMKKPNNPNNQWSGHDDASHQMLAESGVEFMVWDGFLNVEAYMDGKRYIV